MKQMKVEMKLSIETMCVGIIVFLSLTFQAYIFKHQLDQGIVEIDGDTYIVVKQQRE